MNLSASLSANRIALAVLPWLLGSCTDEPESISPGNPGLNEPMLAVESSLLIPEADDWVDHGEVLQAGEPGDWDLYLWGGFAATAVKRDGTYFLYYQGSEGYDEQYHTVSFRSIGLATSTDGTTFTKHPSNPVLTWSPTGDLEEGAASAGAWIDDGGVVQLYYGANTSTSPGLVSADGRLANSRDGVHFSDRGIVLESEDSQVWGWGDELFPIIGFTDGTTWFTYYIPNGTVANRQLGVAWGPKSMSLTESAEVLADGRWVPAWGPGGWGRLSGDEYAIFVSAGADGHIDGGHVDVYRMSTQNPALLDGPVRTYAFPNMIQATVLFDGSRERWLLFYRNSDASAYGVRSAPITRDDSPGVNRPRVQIRSTSGDKP